MAPISVGILGATGMVGQQFIALLAAHPAQAEKHLPDGQVDQRGEQGGNGLALPARVIRVTTVNPQTATMSRQFLDIE